MRDGVGGGNEQSHPGVLGVDSDPKVLVATAATVAALLLAGSAYVWRRGSGVMNLAHAASDGTTSQTDTPHGKDVSNTTKARLRRDARGKVTANTARWASVSALGGSPLSDDADATDDADELQGGSARQREAAAGSMGKSARAKERRRRGKDPMRELMKPGGGKLGKVLKATDFPTSSGTSAPLSRSRATSTSEVQQRVSTSGQQEKSPSDDSSTTQKAGSSSSSTVLPSSSTLSDALNQGQFLSSSLSSTSTQSVRPRSKSRSRSRPRKDSAYAIDHEPITSKSTDRNSGAASTISSASSSTATEASSSSTAPSSLSSSERLDADATPKAGSGRTTMIPVQGKKPRQQEPSNPWDWDGVGSSSASQSKPPPSQKSQPKPPKPPISSSPPPSGTVGASVPYASVVSAKSPKEEDSRSTVGTRTEAKQHQPSLSSSDDNAETVEAEGEAEGEVPLVFPSLNTPAPLDSASSSVSASTPSSISVGPASNPPSLSRPHSRASNPSSPHSGQLGGLKSKSPAPRNVNSASMTPLSVTAGTPPGGGGVGPRRAPTPLGSMNRPATPGTGSAASSPLLSSFGVVPPSPSSQSFGSSGFQGGSSTVALSTQTQVASLRGALEASRLREEKHKDEVERVTKERDMMLWENAAWKRREAELQSQVQQMMHQLQTYAAYFASSNHGLHPPHVFSPTPQSLSASTSTTGLNAPSGLRLEGSISTRNKDIANHDDDTPIANAGDPLQIVSPTSAQNSDNDTSGGNSGEKDANGGGVSEGSAVGEQLAGSSVPELDSAPTSAAKAAAGGEAGSTSQDPTTGAPHNDGSGISQTTPLTVSTSTLSRPAPIAPPAFNPASTSGVMSPSILHSPMGPFSHYPLYATPPVGFGPHALPSPMAFPFHTGPAPLQLSHVQQHHAFMASGSAPQSPGAAMMPPHPFAMNPNPFVVSPAASAFHRPGTPNSAGVNAMAFLNSHPHPHTPSGMGMGLGNSMSSPFSMGGPRSGTASPDLTGSPNSATAFLMHDWGRRRMSNGSASGSGLSRGARGRGSVTVLPFDSGIGGGSSSKRGGKSSSGSSVNGEASGEEHSVADEEADFNEVLVGAILKRPESIKIGSSRMGSFRAASSTSSLGDGATSFGSSGLGLSSGSVSLNGIWAGHDGQGGVDRTVSPGSIPERHELGQEEDKQREELVFPSLNDVGPLVSEGTAPSSHSGSTAGSVLHSKSPPPRSSSPALGTLLEEESGDRSMIKSGSAPEFFQSRGPPVSEHVERSSTNQ